MRGRHVASRFLAASLTALSPHVQAASACTPIDYRGEFPRGSVVEQMVARAATIQVMRVKGRTFAWRYPYETYPPVYTFEFEPVDTWKGWDLGVLQVNAHAAGGADEFDWAYASASILNTRAEAQWESPDLIDLFQAWVEPDPDVDSLACRLPLAFQVGASYLVFRDERGELLERSFRMTQRGEERWLLGPSVMPMNDAHNRWARAVRAEISTGWRTAR